MFVPRCLCVWLYTDADSISHAFYVSFHWFLDWLSTKNDNWWSTISMSGTMNYRTFSIQKWQTSFSFNLQHLIFTVETWLALPSAVPLVSFDVGLAIIFRQVRIGFLAPNSDITEKSLCGESLESLAHSKFFALNISLGQKSIPTNPVDTPLYVVLLISVGQLLMLDDEVLCAESKQEWGERPAEVNREAQSTAVILCLGTCRSPWNTPLFRVYEGKEGINQLMVELLWQLMHTQVESFR